MSTRLYFDLKAVADQARHAILADHTSSTRQQTRDNVAPGPALWFFRHAGRVQLSSNDARSGFDIATSKALTVYAQPQDALTTPAVRPPDAADSAIISLLEPDGRSLFDLLCDGLDAGRQWAMLRSADAHRRRRPAPPPHACRHATRDGRRIRLHAGRLHALATIHQPSIEDSRSPSVAGCSPFEPSTRP